MCGVNGLGMWTIDVYIDDVADDGNGREYTEKDGQLDAWLAEQGQKPELHVDDMVEALDPPSRQCVAGLCWLYRWGVDGSVLSDQRVIYTHAPNPHRARGTSRRSQDAGAGGAERGHRGRALPHGQGARQLRPGPAHLPQGTSGLVLGFGMLCVWVYVFPTGPNQQHEAVCEPLSLTHTHDPPLTFAFHCNGPQKVRDLSREQFFAVAHVNKIYRTQQAAIVAARGAAGAAMASGLQQQQQQQQQAPPGQFAGPISYPVLPGQRK